ncbi:transglutaminase-like domain-containing protein [Thalassoglobus sp.]|uniref:transglutaminase-like domain-containing protein n=1 Tax=Thalassoglobus sp. TaxID=2795869 RepID=UPI003AA9BAEB
MPSLQFRCSALFVLVLLSFALLSGQELQAQEPAKSDLEESWQTIWSQGQRVGYSHSTSSEKKVEGETVFVTDTLLSMTFNRFGQTLSIRQQSHVEETEDGKLLRFSSTMENPPNSKTVTSGFLQGAEIKLTSKVAGRSTTKTISGMEDVFSLSWPERIIQEGKLKRGEPQTFEVFEPQIGNKAKITVEYSKDVPLPKEGAFHREVTLQEKFAGAPPIESIVTCDQDWSLVKVSMPLLKMEMRTATEDEALAPIGEHEFDLATDTMVRVSGMENVQQAKSVTYRIEVDGANPAEIFEESANQKIRVIDDETIELTVNKKTLKNYPRLEGESSSAADSFMQASQYLECEAPILVSLASKVKEGESATETSVALEKFVKNYVSDKNFSTAMATAAEVAQSRAGDCTEHAVLLAALLRIKEIPSRVAIGFVYSAPHKAFVGHMWTEAWLNGQWVPLDATLGHGGTGCGHLTITTSSLSDDEAAPAARFLPMIHLLGRTKIEVVSTEK